MFRSLAAEFFKMGFGRPKNLCIKRYTTRSPESMTAKNGLLGKTYVDDPVIKVVGGHKFMVLLWSLEWWEICEPKFSHFIYNIHYFA